MTVCEFQVKSFNARGNDEYPMKLPLISSVCSNQAGS